MSRTSGGRRTAPRGDGEPAEFALPCRGVRRYFFEVLALALIGGSMFFFKESIDYLARRDYVASLIVMMIGLAVITVGKEMARLALVQRD